MTLLEILVGTTTYFRMSRAFLSRKQVRGRVWVLVALFTTALI